MGVFVTNTLAMEISRKYCYTYTMCVTDQDKLWF